MWKRLVVVIAITLGLAVTADTPAFTQNAAKTKNVPAGEKAHTIAGRRIKLDADGKQVSPYSLAVRTANNRADCKPNALKPDGVGIHGHYRGYGSWDPELKSIEGRKQFEACVKRGLEPAPWFAFIQRATFAQGGRFFGKTKEDCLKCHEKGY